MKKGKFLFILMLLLISFVVVMIVNIQLNNIFKVTPKVDESYSVNLNDSKINYDNVLNNLKSITEIPHYFPSENNELTMKKITKYLDDAGINYYIQDDLFTPDLYFNKWYQDCYELFLNDEELNPNHVTNLDDLVKKDGYDSFDDYLISILNSVGEKDYKTIEDVKKDMTADIDYITNKNNIIISLGDIDEQKDSIIISAHYDSGKGIEDKNELSLGASDNGMNVVAALECARLFKNTHFNNNVYIAIVNAEENEFWGADWLIESDAIKNIKLVLNFDNCGSGGHLIPTRYTNGLIVKKYLNNLRRTNGFSLSNDIYTNLISSGEFSSFGGTDYDVYSKKYDSIDFSLFMDNKNYHTKNDSFENINVNSLKETVNIMYKLIEYFGNDTDDYSTKEDYWFISINGMTIRINNNIYRIIVIVLMIALLPYLWYLFKKKRILSLIINTIMVILAVISYIYLDFFTILFIIPVLLSFISNLLSNNSKVQTIFDVCSYVVVFYLFAFFAIQLMAIIMYTAVLFLVPVLYAINAIHYKYRKVKK